MIDAFVSIFTTPLGVSAFAGVALSAPVFVIGTLVVLVFAQKLRWAPAGGYVPLARISHR